MASLMRRLGSLSTALALALFAPIAISQPSSSNSLLGQAIQSTLSRSWPSSDRLTWLVLDASTGDVLAQQWPSLDAPAPVGSLTKPFLAAAYARAHAAFPHTLCRGTRDRCWLPKGHGTLDLPHALAHSCNAYFLALASQLDPAALQTTTHLYNLPAPPLDATPAVLIGLEPAWQISPLTLARAYTRLVTHPENKPILNGMALATQQGTASPLRAEAALAKTGTTPCLQHCLASGDGLVVALTPAANPRVLLLVRQRGTTGAATAILAAQMLHTLKARNVSR